MKTISILLLSIYFLYVFGCGGSSNRESPKPQCKTAMYCLDLVKKTDSNYCQNKSYSDSSYLLKNNHSSKNIYALIYRYESKKEGRWTIEGPNFVDANLIFVPNKKSRAIGCVEGRIEDGFWIEYNYEIHEACFEGELGPCNVIIENLPPFIEKSCEYCDTIDEFCIKQDMNQSDTTLLVARELFNFSSILRTKFYNKNYQFDLNSVFPIFSNISGCNRGMCKINRGVFENLNANCEFGFDITHKEFNQAWVELPENWTAKYDTTEYMGIEMNFQQNKRKPILSLAYCKGDSCMNIKQDLVQKVTILENRYINFETNQYCLNMIVD